VIQTRTQRGVIDRHALLRLDSLDRPLATDPVMLAGGVRLVATAAAAPNLYQPDRRLRCGEQLDAVPDGRMAWAKRS
jgi:hypothetical protein